MFTRDRVPFCAVCQRAISRVIDRYLRSFPGVTHGLAGRLAGTRALPTNTRPSLRLTESVWGAYCHCAASAREPGFLLERAACGHRRTGRHILAR